MIHLDNIRFIISQLTLEEKAALCTGSGPWQTTAIERLGVPKITMTDGPHGVRKVLNIKESGQIKSTPATCFPPAVTLASTWNKELIQKVGEYLGDECISLDVDILLGPGVNMKRTPLCGRNFEYFSEDPYLAGEMGAAFIKGIQSKGVGTSLKHFTANNQEYQRFTINEEIDERTLREIYLAAFEKIVTKSKPWTVMCAYNKINGIFASEHYDLLTRILKSEWGFEGFVISDWGAVHDRIAALKGGLDLQMPGPYDLDVQRVIKAVKDKKLDEKVLDQAVERILKIVFKAKKTKKGLLNFDKEKHHRFARKVAVEGIILLKNEHNLLPIKDVTSIALIGRMAKEPRFQGGGSSLINPTKIDTSFEEIKKLVGDNIIVRYADGYNKDKLEEKLITEACNIAEQSDIVLLFTGLPFEYESEGYDRITLGLPNNQVELIKSVANINSKTVVILNNGAPVDMLPWVNQVSGIIESYLPGQAGGGAIADILFGIENPSGKLAETFPEKLEHNPAHINYPGDAGKVRYGERLYIGYRYYDKKLITPLFPFGYGLSYTTFSYSNLTVSKKSFKDIDGVSVSLNITNTGKILGKEIIQLYIHECYPTVSRPYKELKGFEKVLLQPNETKTVTFHLDSRAFAFYSEIYRSWICNEGEYKILVGTSSRDIKLTTSIILESTQKLPSKLNIESIIQDWFNDSKGNILINKIIDNQVNLIKTRVSDETMDKKQIREGLLKWMVDRPFLTFLKSFENDLPMPAENLIKSFLIEIGVPVEKNDSH